MGHYKSKQTGWQWGPPVSTIVANLFTSHMESDIFANDIKSQNWLRYMDDTFVVIKKTFLRTFLNWSIHFRPTLNLLTMKMNRDIRWCRILDGSGTPGTTESLWKSDFLKFHNTRQSWKFEWFLYKICTWKKASPSETNNFSSYTRVYFEVTLIWTIGTFRSV